MNNFKSPGLYLSTYVGISIDFKNILLGNANARKFVSPKFSFTHLTKYHL